MQVHSKIYASRKTKTTNHVQMHCNIYVSRKLKTSTNLGRKEQMICAYGARSKTNFHLSMYLDRQNVIHVRNNKCQFIAHKCQLIHCKTTKKIQFVSFFSRIKLFGISSLEDLSLSFLMFDQLFILHKIFDSFIVLLQQHRHHHACALLRALC